MIINKVELYDTVVFLPLLLLEVYIFALGISMFLAAAFVKFRDIGYIWEVVLQAGFYITPILYALSRVTNVDLQKIILMNPMAQAIQDIRYCVVTHSTITIRTVFDGGWYALIPLFIVVATLIGGLAYFRSQSDSFAENI